jgi:hypothetical protein
LKNAESLTHHKEICTAMHKSLYDGFFCGGVDMLETANKAASSKTGK